MIRIKRSDGKIRTVSFSTSPFVRDVLSKMVQSGDSDSVIADTLSISGQHDWIKYMSGNMARQDFKRTIGDEIDYLMATDG